MSEEEEKPQEQATPKDAGDGDKSEATRPIDDANLAAKRLEEITKVYKEENDRRERLLIEEKLSGKSDAGEKPAKKEEDPQDFSKKLMTGEATIELIK